jgi:hypothetical protein
MQTNMRLVVGKKKYQKLGFQCIRVYIRTEAGTILAATDFMDSGNDGLINSWVRKQFIRFGVNTNYF